MTLCRGLGSLIFMVASADMAAAATYQFTPSNGAYADGEFSVMIDGITTSTKVDFVISGTIRANCTITSSTTQSNCLAQSVSGFVPLPPNAFNLAGFGSGFYQDNVQIGSGIGEIGVFSFSVLATPANNIITFLYDHLSGTPANSSIAFQMTIAGDEARPIALAGNVVGGFQPSEVPLPAALPLLTAALAGLGYARRRATVANNNAP